MQTQLRWRQSSDLKSRRIKFWILSCAGSSSHRYRVEKSGMIAHRARAPAFLKWARGYGMISNDFVAHQAMRTIARGEEFFAARKQHHGEAGE
jgi:hypothetical protein